MVAADQQVEADLLGSRGPPHQILRRRLLGHQRVAHLGHHSSSIVAFASSDQCCPARSDLTRAVVVSTRSAGGFPAGQGQAAG
jgi:hypothetical protein